LTARQTRYKNIKGTQYMSIYILGPRTELDRSPKEEQWRWESGSLIGCTKHYGYRLMGTAGSTRLVPITSMQSLAALFYRLKSRNTPTGAHLKPFGHGEDDICQWCRGGAVQTQEHPFSQHS